MPGPLPVFFIPHGGGPCFFMDWDPPDTWKKMGAWLSSLAATVPQRPKAILVISGHWEEDNFSVTGAKKPDLIFDYSGFPPHTYQLSYPAPGAPDLAERVTELLGRSAITTATDKTRGFDHGVFVPFKLIYPDADIPVIQLSLKKGLSPAEHIAAGKALAPLRDEGVLIVGSGMSYHNLREFFRGGKDVEKSSDAFDAWLNTTLAAKADRRDMDLTAWEEAPYARSAHPREEHLLPLMVVAGAAGSDTGGNIYSERVMGSRVSAWRFG